MMIKVSEIESVLATFEKPLDGIQFIIHRHLTVKADVTVSDIEQGIEEAMQRNTPREYVNRVRDAVYQIIATHLLSDESDVYHIVGQDFAHMLMQELAIKESSK